MYQNVLPQFLWVRSIFSGEILISFLMFMTGRALARQKTEGDMQGKYVKRTHR